MAKTSEARRAAESKLRAVHEFDLDALWPDQQEIAKRANEAVKRAQCSRVHGIQCVYHAAGGSTELGCGGDEPIVVQPATGALYLDPADGEIVRVVPRDVSDGDVEDGCSVVVIEVAGRSLQWRHGERVWRNMTGWVLLRDARGMVPDAVRSLGGSW